MPFTNPGFPGQIFSTVEEFEEARIKRAQTEDMLSERGEEITKITATVIPASRELLEKRLLALEDQVQKLIAKLEGSPTHNKEGIIVGTVLQGESKGRKYTLEALEEDYLCSDGNIYQSLSGAALGVSGNRRSGWKFWRDVAGTPIGGVTGRFEKNATSNPFDSRRMP